MRAYPCWELRGIQDDRDIYAAEPTSNAAGATTLELSWPYARHCNGFALISRRRDREFVVACLSGEVARHSTDQLCTLDSYVLRSVGQEQRHITALLQDPAYANVAQSDLRYGSCIRGASRCADVEKRIYAKALIAHSGIAACKAKH